MKDKIILVFEELLKELNSILLELNQRGSQFFNEGNYDQASQVIDQIKAACAIQEKVLSIREEWSQIDVSVTQQKVVKKTKVHRKQTKMLKSGLRTPNEAFHLPILRALVQLGGSGSVQAVLDRVHHLMKDQLNEYDYQSIPSDPKVVRWENNAQWARFELVKQGFLASDSPRGVWEITVQGRQRLAEASEGNHAIIADQLGEYHTQPLALKEHMRKISFEVGKIYNRQTDLHDKYGGNRQSGIAACAEYPIVFLFTAEAGDEFGYQDGWRSENEYIYTGEGQIGDMEMARGNRAIRDHQADGRALHLFKKASSGQYAYLGEFAYQNHEITRGDDAEGNARDVIRFVLKKV